MSINSIDHDDMANMASKWDFTEEAENTTTQLRPGKDLKSAEARRRIEMLREIRESGLTIEEAKELGLLH
ncbi:MULTISPECIES: hypothetical protein [Vibrio]|uniref:Uncharacterized protein n=2 Tax=Vibrio TaxID=662 RepID=A0A7X4RWD7_9VIBR|nr:MULTISPECIES: hypothetical protein [Vibrio]MBF9003428.1 hypothetical protein [Vibrio nitrifigilis]MZI95275.1 hypothetical protein [Vibrio eleionomae]